MKRKFRKSIVYLFIFALLLAPSSQALACTGVIIGEGVSADGNPMIGRTEDWQSAYNKMLIATPAKTYQPGDMYTDVYGFSYPMPEKTYRTVTIPDGYQEEGDIFEAAGWNEMGVTMTATVTASSNEAALAADPLTQGGLYESSVVSVVLPRIETARQGVDVLADIMDTRGVQEGACIAIADQNEIWYMELLSGHQYVAIKYPKDAFSVFPNCFMLGKVDINDKENVVASADIINLPREHGFLVEEDGYINIKKTYGEELSSKNRDRLWGGINFLDKDKKIPYDAEDFDFIQTTDKKISLKDVMEFQRTRYEGTFKDANLAENKGVRPIGTVEQEEAHIIQIKKDYPRELGGVLWVAMGNAEHSMYVPTFGAITDTIAPYQVQGDSFDENSAYWTMRQVSALSEIDRDLYGTYVREYFDKMEKAMIQDQAKIDQELISTYQASPGQAVALATDYSKQYQQRAFDDAKLLSKELNTYFFDVSGNAGVKGNKKVEFPYVPSLLGEERKLEIYKERNLPITQASAQPLDKGNSNTENELANHWAKKVMEEAVAAGYLEKIDNAYAPDTLVSTSEVLTALEKLNPNFNKDSITPTLEKKAIRAPYLLNRQSLAFILDQYMKETKVERLDAKVKIKDEKTLQPWTKESVKQVMAKGYMKGHKGNFDGNSLVSRAQLAQILSSMK